jgi:hypothetical protein
MEQKRKDIILLEKEKERNQNRLDRHDMNNTVQSQYFTFTPFESQSNRQNIKRIQNLKSIKNSTGRQHDPI